MNTTPQTQGPDISQLADKGLPEGLFPGGSRQSFRVYLAPEVHTGIWQHATENGSVEICGVLVGRWACDGAGPHAQASAYIRGEAAASKFAEVTFTHETWARINEQMDTRYANQSVIGWYHSHPDFGIFLSDRDRFIQEHFFAGPGQFAYVVDPIRKTEGVFIWKQGKPILAPYHWVGERVQVSTPASEESPESRRVDGSQKTSAEGTQSGITSAHAAEWIDAFMRPAGYACVFLLGLVLASYMTKSLNDFERAHIEQAARLQALINLNYRPGLGEDLDEIGTSLAAAETELIALAKKHPDLSADTKEKEGPWQGILKKVDRARERTTLVKSIYALSPEDSARLLALLNGKKTGEGKEDKKDKSAKGETASGEKEQKPAGQQK